MANTPLAYHITVGTYGMRLHGDPRGTVDRTNNRPGDPILGRDEDWQHEERSLLKFDPIVLAAPQRVFIEGIVPAICERGGWDYHIAAARLDHVHVELSSPNDGQIIRQLVKRWLSEELSTRWPLPSGAVWWAECGSVKWVWEQCYFQNVYDYIRRQRTSPMVPAESSRAEIKR